MKVARRGPKTDHTLPKTGPSLPPSPLGEAHTRPRSTKYHLSPRLSCPTPSLPTHIPLPSTSAEGHCVLAGGSSWGPSIGRPTDPGDEEGGAERTGWHCTWHQAKAPPWKTNPIPLSTSVLLLTKESCCFSPSCFPWNSPFLSPTPSQPPLRHCRDLPLSIHSQHCALWEPRSLSVSCVNLVFGWLKQGGQSPLDPKGAPISRDV